jgi:hypothetical protein
MNIFLYYFDKLTAWFDFSWLVTKQKNISIMSDEVEEIDDNPPRYITEPLLRA